MSTSSYRPGSPTEGAGLSAWLRFKAGVRRADSRAIARDAGFDVDDDEIVVCRDLEVGNDAEGGYAVNDGFVGGLVRARDEHAVLRKMATLFERKDGSPFSMATVNDTANYATVIDEEVDQTSGTHMAFGTANLTPKKLATKILKVTEELLADATFDLEVYLAEELGARCWRGQNHYATNGLGFAEPQGVLGGGTEAVAAASETTFTASEVIRLCAALPSVHREGAVLMMNQQTYSIIAQLVSGTGNYLLSQLAGRSETVQGSPIVLNAAMPNATAGQKPLAVGDFSQLAISEIPGVTIQFLRELYAPAGQVGVRAYLRTNSAVLNASAIQYLTMSGTP